MSKTITLTEHRPADGLLTMRVRNTTYNVNIFFNPNAKSTLDTQMRKIIQKYTKNRVFVITYQGKSGEKSVVFYNQGMRRDTHVSATDPDIIGRARENRNYTSLVQRLRGCQCEWCGATDVEIEIHHVKKLKDLSGRAEWERHMIARRRKTMALCHNCHVKLHAGKLD